MDAQSWWTAAVAVLAVVLAVSITVRTRRRSGARRLDPGLSVRSGAVGELLRGAAFSVPFLALLLVAMPLTGLTATSGPQALGPAAAASAGIAVYFAVLFLVEEVLFRGLLLGGLGVLAGRAWALAASSVLVALAYAFAPGTSVLAVVGAVVANALPGWARWRSGRIWWGLGQRWVWNVGIVAAGLRDSGFALQAPLLRQEVSGPAWVTGGAFGVEGGVVGIAFLLVMTVATTRWATGRRGPWRGALPAAHR